MNLSPGGSDAHAALCEQLASCLNMVTTYKTTITHIRAGETIPYRSRVPTRHRPLHFHQQEQATLTAHRLRESSTKWPAPKVPSSRIIMRAAWRGLRTALHVSAPPQQEIGAGSPRAHGQNSLSCEFSGKSAHGALDHSVASGKHGERCAHAVRASRQGGSSSNQSPRKT